MPYETSHQHMARINTINGTEPGVNGRLCKTNSPTIKQHNPAVKSAVLYKMFGGVIRAFVFTIVNTKALICYLITIVKQKDFFIANYYFTVFTKSAKRPYAVSTGPPVMPGFSERTME